MSSGRELAKCDAPSSKSMVAVTPALVAKSEDHERQLAHALQDVKAQVAELMLSMRNEPERLEENQRQLTTLLSTLKQVEGQQTKLKQDLDYQRRELETIRAKHTTSMKREEAKPAPPLLMEELRALNQLKLDAADTAVRNEKAQQPKKYVASGGLTGFRVASDLYKMDLSTDEQKDPDEWRAAKPKKK